MIELDASDPGRAAIVAFAAAWLFARTSGMNAENIARQSQGWAMRYDHTWFEWAIDEAVAMAKGVRDGE